MSSNGRLRQKQENFVLDVLGEVKPGKAYLKHYKCKSIQVADAAASRLLKSVKVAARLRELRERAADATVGDLREACQVSTAIMRAKLSDFTDENGRIDKRKLDSHAIQSIDEVSSMAGTAVITKLRLHSPLEGIEKLARLKKWYEPGLPINQDNRVINIFVMDGEAKELLEGIAERTKKLKVGSEAPE